MTCEPYNIRTVAPLDMFQVPQELARLDEIRMEEALGGWESTKAMDGVL